ncbi:PIN domain-containing protein [Clostridium sp. CMCC3677]|uniref:PIN domain-containing protein n=1 Tax=Clostridium sp. CMCC3677 TaxID=2949963 RepID=UPI0013F1113F|nr:PIN domain-containing protein [Clostridium sp. CMCC3677]NFG63149.1 hypothetical protein [Clostridium botulinum]NFQ10966.1 hypothetical protein [Clostridium botulinum]
MNKYMVFIDTNIYDAANYNFNNGAFSKLKKLVDSGNVVLLINSVIEIEVKNHIKSRIYDAVNIVNKDLNDRIFVPFRHEDEYKTKVELLDKKFMTKLLEDRFYEFLSMCKAIHITLNNINVEKIMSDYSEKKYPFENSKPEEFKDAIAIQSLILYKKNMDDECRLCVVSNDKGFRKSINVEDVGLFDDLGSFIDMITTLDDKTKCLKEFIEEGYIYDEIIDEANIAVERINYSTEQYVDDLEIGDTKINNYEISYVDIIDMNSAKVIVDVDAEIEIICSFVDEEQSCYDKEERQYLWKKEIETKEIHNINFELTIELHISKFSDNICLEEGKEIKYDGDEVSVRGYSDVTNSILLDEYTLASSEIISSSDQFCNDYEDEDEENEIDYAYSTCPDCGCPIGINNDGGNGFCINCAPNH